MRHRLRPTPQAGGCTQVALKCVQRAGKGAARFGARAQYLGQPCAAVKGAVNGTRDAASCNSRTWRHYTTPLVGTTTDAFRRAHGSVH